MNKQKCLEEVIDEMKVYLNNNNIESIYTAREENKNNFFMEIYWDTEPYFEYVNICIFKGYDNDNELIFDYRINPFKNKCYDWENDWSFKYKTLDEVKNSLTRDIIKYKETKLVEEIEKYFNEENVNVSEHDIYISQLYCNEISNINNILYYLNWDTNVDNSLTYNNIEYLNINDYTSLFTIHIFKNNKEILTLEIDNIKNTYKYSIDGDFIESLQYINYKYTSELHQFNSFNDVKNLIKEHIMKFSL